MYMDNIWIEITIGGLLLFTGVWIGILLSIHNAPTAEELWGDESFLYEEERPSASSPNEKSETISHLP